jgi:EmrB/QacA subfamily drug resistance transporter
MPYKWRAAIIGAVGLFMAVLDNTIVNVALPQMRIYFHTDLATIQWVATAYFLAQAAVIPIVGYLADRVGSKVVFLSALALFTVGSGLCIFAPTETLLIIFRVIQGIGGGALFPIVFALIFRVFPPSERGPASSVVGVPVLLAPVFGPTIGGYLTQTFDWHAIFAVNLPIGVVVLIFGLIFLKGRTQEFTADSGLVQDKKAFDLVGLILAMVGTTAFVYGVSEYSSYVFTDTHVWPFIAGGGVLLLAFVLYELRAKDPVMDVRLFGNYTFAIANILTWAVSAFLFGSLLLLPFFFETVQGKGPLDTGLIFIWQGVGSIVGVILGGQLYNRTGPRTIAFVGMALVAVASFGFTSLTVSTNSQSLQLWLVFRGLGLGLTNIPLQTLAVSRLSNQALNRASSLVNVTRQIFSAVGISALTTYLTHQATSYGPSVAQTFQTTQLATVQANCAAQLGNNPSGIQACVQQASQTYITQHASVLGLNDTFWVVVIGTGLSAVLALFVGRDPNVQALKAAKARGETVEIKPAVIGE